VRTSLGALVGTAWIQDPKTANTARFHWDPKSWSADPWYFVDSGRPRTGAPPLLKTRRHMRRDDARKLWLALQEGGAASDGAVGRRRRSLSPAAVIVTAGLVAGNLVLFAPWWRGQDTRERVRERSAVPMERRGVTTADNGRATQAFGAEETLTIPGPA